jgi:hypothetical protein
MSAPESSRFRVVSTSKAGNEVVKDRNEVVKKEGVASGRSLFFVASLLLFTNQRFSSARKFSNLFVNLTRSQAATAPRIVGCSGSPSKVNGQIAGEIAR